MPSEQSQAMEDLFHRLRTFMQPEAPSPELFRILSEEFASVTAEPADVTYHEATCPGTVRPAIWCTPLSASPSRVILYLHGGGFIGGSPSSHRKPAAHLAKRAGCHAIVIDYRRAPEHQFPTQIEDVIATYKWLIDNRGIASKNIVFAGDSAGGHLVVAAALQAQKLGLDTPAAIVAFSPWFDMKLRGKSFQTNAGRDALTPDGAMQGAVGAYVGNASLDGPLVDLLHADLSGLPPMYLAAGTAEVLQDDATRMADTARIAGVEVHLELAEDMQHVWVFMAGTAPEADGTLSRAAEFICSKMEI